MMTDRSFGIDWPMKNNNPLTERPKDPPGRNSCWVLEVSAQIGPLALGKTLISAEYYGQITMFTEYYINILMIGLSFH